MRDGKWHKQNELPIAGPTVRAICQEWPDEFVGLPAKGYCLFEYADAEDIEHSIKSLNSRARKIWHRAKALENRYYEGGKQGDMFG